MKRTAFFLCFLLLLFLTAYAAGEDLAFLDPESAPEVTRMELGLPKKTLLPVYSAPMENAWRGAKGKASVSADEPFALLGTAQGGQWLLIDYRVKAGERRIGWIACPENYEPEEGSGLYFSRVLCRVREDGLFTDDPEMSLRKVMTLRAGETAIVMFSMEAGGKEWLYAEAEADGQPAWGFVEADKLEPMPVWTVEGDRLVVREGMTRIGYVTEEDETPIQAGEFWSDTVFLDGGAGNGIRRIVFPGSVRQFGFDAVFGLTGQEVVLSGHPTIFETDAFSGWISRIILEADFTGAYPVCCGALDAWEVREGNPVYSARDGVLFSADGRVLFAYPAGKEALHYDVPAGTEEIADMAFDDDNMDLPLQTISLPIGLRRIGAYAFSGCGRLHSLTVPLTVTELAPNAFYNCVSLERLSLPPGMTVSRGGYAQHEDLSHYMGDNGATLTHPRPADSFSEPEKEKPVWASAWLSGENGEGPVPVYASPEAEKPVRELPSGTAVSYSAISGRRARIWDWGKESWIDFRNLLPSGNRAFFYVSGASPSGEGREALRQQGMEDFQFARLEEDSLTVIFGRQAEDGMEEDIEASLPVSQVSLYRQDGGENRTFALLRAEAPGRPVRLLDAPGGREAGWTYTGEQAEILETSGEWVKIRTTARTAWVERDRLVPVEPEPSGEDITPLYY